jgi:inhibitor of the pro-sigma K processing machinery
MLKKIYRIIKSLIVGALILYAYNIIASPLNLIIPINVITVLLVSFLGFPALFALVLLLVIAF